MDIHAILKRYWGYDLFRPKQEDIILSVLNGNDTLALLPTGGGKSICFQVPALAKNGICIVVTPLIALMKDQVENLQIRGINAAAIYIGLPNREIEKILRQCEQGEYKFLYLSPERLKNKLLINSVLKMNVNFLVVDEAHCISQWGYDFRPPYLEIAQFRKNLPPQTPVLALTATATPDVVKDIQQKLDFKKENVIQKSFLRENLIYVVLETENKEKRLLQIVRNLQGTGIIYVRNRKKTMEIAHFLIENGITADFYHAGLEVSVREKKQNDWKNDKIRIIVSTNAFGMGIDKPDVRFVIHLDIPDTLEAYFQEAGRGGRDEKRAYAITLYNNTDIINLKKNFESSFPQEKDILAIYQHLCNFYHLPVNEGKGLSFDFDSTLFANTYQLSPLLIYHSLTFLERMEWILLTDSIKNTSKVNIAVDSEELYQIRKNYPKYSNFIETLLRSYQGLFSVLSPINEDEIAQRTNLDKQEVILRLQELNKLGIIIYEQQTKYPKIHFLESRIDPKFAKISKEVYIHRKKVANKQLEAVISYIKSEQKCRSKILLKYFGENSTIDCGYCDVCIARKRANKMDAFMTKIIEDITNILNEKTLSIEELKELLPYKENDIIVAIRFLLGKEIIYQDVEKKFFKK